MREIKYRVLIDDQWVYGHPVKEPYLLYDQARWYFYDDTHRRYRVENPETIGQYTGLKDKNGKEIYERDVLRSFHFQDNRNRKHYLRHIVKWSDSFHSWICLSCDSMDEKDGSPQLFVYEKYGLEVVGNTHENPELLEKT